MPKKENQSADSGPPFSDTMADILDKVSYRRVSAEHVNDPVYRLRYEAYRRENFIPINSQMVLEDDWDKAPNARCYGVYIGDQLVSSVRIHHVASTESVSPSRTLWPEVLTPILEQGKSYIDPTRFTADHEASLAYPLLPFITLRIAVMASDHYDVDYCVGAVRQEHGAFYRRVFRSALMGEERHFNGLRFPMYLYVADRAILRGLYGRYPVFRSTPEERTALFDATGENVYTKKVKLTALLALRDSMELPEEA